MKRVSLFLLAALLLLFAGSPPARAASLYGRSSTQLLYFTDERDDDHVDIAEYLRFYVRGLDKADTLHVTGYGRAWGDVAEGGGIEGRLYYLYLDKKRIAGKADVRLGRQFFFVSAGSAIVDGARLDARPVEKVAVTLVGGRHVLFGETGEATKGGDVAAGAQVEYLGIPDGSVGLSYYTSWDESELARQLIGLSANKRFTGLGEAYTQLRFDWLSEVFSEILVGARTGALLPRLTLKAEYFRSIPVFDATSIFVVFAAEEFTEALLRADYELTPKVTLNGEYRHEWFGGGDKGSVGEAGVRYRPRDGFNVYGAGIWRVGTGGNIYGFELSGDAVVKQRFIVAAGVQHDQFRRELMASYDPATRIWVGGEARLRKNLSVSGRIEDTVSEKYDADVRARLALNYDF